MDSKREDILFILGEMRGDIKAVLNNQNALENRMNRQDKKIDGQDNRIGGLEKSRAWLLGGAFGVSTAVSAIMAGLFQFFTHNQ
jgi:hypothetical protein